MVKIPDTLVLKVFLDFSKSRGLWASVSSVDSQPLLRQGFALSPISARPECGKALRTDKSQIPFFRASAQK